MYATYIHCFTVWGYGLLFVTLINLLSLVGIVVLPLMKKSFYSTLLMFLIALAVGTLTASGGINLIPGVSNFAKICTCTGFVLICLNWLKDYN